MNVYPVIIGISYIDNVALNKRLTSVTNLRGPNDSSLVPLKLWISDLVAGIALKHSPKDLVIQYLVFILSRRALSHCRKC